MPITRQQELKGTSDRVEGLRRTIGELKLALAKEQANLREAKQRNQELAIALMRKSAEVSESDETLKRWRIELEIVAVQSGHNLCHIWIPNLLKATIGHTGNFPDPEGMTEEEFKLGCEAYRKDIFRLKQKPSE